VKRQLLQLSFALADANRLQSLFVGAGFCEVRIERIRRLQDETGGFTAFISWTFQPEHTDMADIPPAGSFEYLKTQGLQGNPSLLMAPP